jgi:hypothetical protein
MDCLMCVCALLHVCMYATLANCICWRSAAFRDDGSRQWGHISWIMVAERPITPIRKNLTDPPLPAAHAQQGDMQAFPDKGSSTVSAHFCGRCLYFSFSTHKQFVLSHLIHQSTAMFPQIPYTLAGFEPVSSCSWGRCNVHCATPPGPVHGSV